MLSAAKNIYNRFKNSRLLNSAFKIASGNVIAQVLAIAFTPILSRIFGPKYYGEFGVFTSTYMVVNGMVCLGLISAILSPKDDKDASGIYKICVISSTTFSILLFAIVMLISPWYKVVHVSANYYIVCILLAVCLITNNIVSMNYTWGNRQKAYKILFWNPIISSVVNFTVAGIIGFIGLKEYGLILGFIISQIVVFFHIYIRFRPMKYENSFSDFKRLLIEYSDFPKYQMPSHLLRGVAASWPILLMSALFGDVFLGQYNMGQRLLSIPITFVGMALGQVHFKQATDLANEGKDPGEITYKVIKFIIYLLFIPFLILGIFGTPITNIFLGSQWSLSGKIMGIRSFEFVLTAVYYSSSYIFVVIKKQKANLIYNVMLLILNILAMLVGGYIIRDNMLTVILISIVNSIMFISFHLYAFSCTEFGIKPFVKLILLTGVTFILLQLTGTFVMSHILN